MNIDLTPVVFYFHLIRSGLFFSILFRIITKPAMANGPIIKETAIKVFIAGSNPT